MLVNLVAIVLVMGSWSFGVDGVNLLKNGIARPVPDAKTVSGVKFKPAGRGVRLVGTFAVLAVYVALVFCERHG